MIAFQDSSSEYSQYITPSELIEFLYCPRFTFFMSNLDIRQYEEKRLKVQIGKEKHIDKSNTNVKYIRKKIGGVSKETEKYLVSKSYGLKGIVDEIYELNDGTFAPLDYKFAEYKDKDFETYKIQMAIYSLMIEDIYKVKVSRFYLVYIRSKNMLKEIEFDTKLRNKTIKNIEKYKSVRTGVYPKGTSYKARCLDCCYRNVCEK